MDKELKKIIETSNSISIAKGKTKIRFENRFIDGTYECYLNLGLRASIYFYHQSATNPTDFSSIFEVPLSTFIDDRQQELIVISNQNAYQKATLVPKGTPLQFIGSDDTAMNRIEGRLFNFIDFRSGNDSNGSGLVLSSNNIRIAITPMANQKDAFNNLTHGGIYEQTHVIKITKIDNGMLTGVEANQVLRIVNGFLTILKGSWCHVVLPVGFEGDNRVWFQLNTPRESYRNPSSWFPIHSAKSVEELFNSFYTTLLSSEKFKLWKTLVYWYQHANNNEKGIDVGIIIGQTAIERLSYYILVQDKKMLNEKEFRDLKASDKLRQLFSKYEIELELPTSLQVMKRNTTLCRWDDGPHAITDIRNALVHPKSKNPEAMDESMYEAWKLTLWYLEVCILKFFQYKGPYTNRLTAQWLGETEELS
jgi:hypothetical protein